MVNRARLKSVFVVLCLFGVGAAVLCLLAASAPRVQPAAPAEYHVYSLKHRTAADVEKVLSEMLAGMDEAAHVVADAKANQILLRGSAKVQQSARQLIESLDQQPAAPAADPVAAKPLVRSYRCEERRAAEMLARVRSAFPEPSDVRAAIDPRTGALIVLAPVDAHTKIAAWFADSPLARPSPASTGRADPQASPDEPTTGLGEHVVVLRNTRTTNVETTVREMFRERLIPLTEGRSRRAAYRFAGAKGRTVELRFDPQRGAVTVIGSGPAADQWMRLIRGLDASPRTDRSTEIVPLHFADPLNVERAVEAYRSGGGSDSQGGTPPGRPSSPPGKDQGGVFEHGMVEQATYLQQVGGQDGGPADAAPRGAAQPDAAPPAVQKKPGEDPDEDRLQRLREMGRDVEVETLPDLDAIIIRGRKRDVDEIKRIIEEVERISAETEPAIDVVHLRHVEGQAISEIIRQVQADVLVGRQGRVTILPLGKPNALLLIGWGEAVKKAKELIAKLDQPADTRSTQRVFRLRRASASTVATTITQFFATPNGLESRVQITPDPRTNAIVVQAAPREMAEVEMLLEKLDAADSDTVFRTRVFKLYNTLANDVYATLQGAIDAARGGGAGGQISAALELLAVDPRDPGRDRLLRSGVLNDVRITPDPRLNVLLVSAPPENMDLLAALIKELDSPGAVAQIKVFRVTNGDANTMVQMLRTLLPVQTGAGGPQLSVAEGEPSTMGLRFSTDSRTNSIIAIGSTGDLRIVEALILRLDELDVQQRKTVVYRLKNSPANDVANAVNKFLTSERQVQMAAPGTLSPFQQIESEVVVVPEPVSNGLIISATPRFFEEINQLVEQLDAQPSQVMIQVLIAEVSLRNTDEFGVELGLQDSVLFDRSVLSGNLLAQTNTTQQSTPSGIITQTEQSFPAAVLNPGYMFNNSSVGNASTNRSLQNAGQVGGQGLSNLGVGRINSELGFGGLVLSASSESVSVLVRALQESNRLEVLGRPHIMTLDNQPAFIQIGKRVPRITGSMAPTLGTGQVFNTFELVNVGLILGVTPRISPEGMVVMEIDAEKSELGPESEGIPVTISEGSVIRSPTFNTTMAQTTVSAEDGETIVLGGLITKNHAKAERKVPYLGDIPVLGNLFKYRFTQDRRTELLIVLTPHVVRTSADADRLKRIESARMHWCLGNVQEIHCDGGLSGAGHAGQVIYPDVNPRGEPSNMPESGKPQPPGSATEPEVLPVPTPAEKHGRKPSAVPRTGRMPALAPAQGRPVTNPLREDDDRSPPLEREDDMPADSDPLPNRFPSR